MMPHSSRDKKRRNVPPPPTRTEEELGLSPQRQIALSLNKIERKSEPDFDRHYGLELGIVLSGRMHRTYETWEAELGPGEAWYCGIWEQHGWSATEAPCEVLVLVIPPEVLSSPEPLGSLDHDWFEPFLVPPERRPRVRPDAREHILAIAQQIRDKSTGRSRLKPTWLRLLTFEALSLLGRNWTSSLGDASLPHSSAAISQAINLVFSERRLVTAREAAHACAMSERTFRRAFEGLMGISFCKFALKHRLEGVAVELLRSDEPLKAIAARWGFVDASHLHHSFVRHHGCTPQTYRQRARLTRKGGRLAEVTAHAPGGRRSAKRRSGA